MVLLRQVRLTVRISCEAHIDDTKAIVKHPQLQRFVSFIAFDGPHFLSKEPLELLNRQASILRDTAHGVRVDGIVPRNR